MNVRDSEVMHGILMKEGFAFTDDPEKADLVIFNTCSVRQHAEDKVWSEVGRLSRGWKKSGHKARNKNITKKPLIGIVGCMAQSYQEQIFKRSAAVDFVVGPADLGKLPSVIGKCFGTQDAGHKTQGIYEIKVWETEGGRRPEEIYRSGFYGDKNHAFVVISEGCSNFCSYCVVPYVRGALRNRDHRHILDEIRRALDQGVHSFTLLGQNVNAYRDEQLGFVELLSKVDALGGLKEFGFITSHPKDTGRELFAAMRGLSKLRKYLHLPAQSGSDRILKLMKRGYNRRHYLDLVEAYRGAVPGGILTTDMIVGFPSETREEFDESVSLLEEVRFDAAYLFKYSPRPHTQAALLEDALPQKEIEMRHARILTLQKKISTQKQRERTGK